MIGALVEAYRGGGSTAVRKKYPNSEEVCESMKLVTLGVQHLESGWEPQMVMRATPRIWAPDEIGERVSLGRAKSAVMRTI